ncbi:MAG: hypothetical protein AAGG07_01480 [Planctomycetota bacterium]
MRRGGYTLVELVVSMTAVSFLVGSMAAVVSIAGRAAPERNDAYTQELRLREALGMLVSDISEADRVRVSSTAVIARVPDRNGDLSPEILEYTWGGAGTSLELTDQDGETAELAENLPELSVEAVTEDVLVSVTPGAEGPEEELYSWATGSGSDLQLTPGQGAFGVFIPSTAKAAFRPTELNVAVEALRDARGDEVLWLEVRTVTPNASGFGPAIASRRYTPIPTAEISIDFPHEIRLPAGDALAVFVWVEGSGTDEVAQFEGRVPKDDVSYYTAAGGRPSQAIDGELYGRYLEADSDVSETRLRAIHVSATTEAGTAVSVTAVPLAPIPVDVY